MRKTTRLKKPQIPELDTLYQFDDLGGRPKYGGVEMTSATNVPSREETSAEIHSAVSEAITAEAAARGAADDDLEEAIEAVGGDLATETAARIAADTAEATARAAADTAEENARIAADTNLQSEIDAIVASSDVKDIVGTKAELDNYDTSTLGDNDIIKVLADETQSDATTYYRYVQSTDSFTLIGAEGPYYTKSATDTLLNAKADKANTYTKAEVDALIAETNAYTVYVRFGTMTSDGQPARHYVIKLTATPDESPSNPALTPSDLQAMFADTTKPVLFFAQNLHGRDTYAAMGLLGKERETGIDGEHKQGSMLLVLTAPLHRLYTFEVASDGTIIRTGNEHPADYVRNSIREIFSNEVNFSDLAAFAANYGPGVYRLTNTSTTTSIALLPKGIEGNANYQLTVDPQTSIIVVVMMQANKYKLLVFGAANNGLIRVALVEPDATAKLKLWTQVVDNLTTTSTDGQKVLAARQGKILADRIGTLSNLQTTDKSSIVAAINELVGEIGNIAAALHAINNGGGN